MELKGLSSHVETANSEIWDSSFQVRSEVSNLRYNILLLYESVVSDYTAVVFAFVHCFTSTVCRDTVMRTLKQLDSTASKDRKRHRLIRRRYHNKVLVRDLIWGEACLPFYSISTSGS